MTRAEAEALHAAPAPPVPEAQVHFYDAVRRTLAAFYMLRAAADARDAAAVKKITLEYDKAAALEDEARKVLRKAIVQEFLEEHDV